MAKRILIVDDEEQFVSMLQMRLEANGYDVLTAYDGQGGIEVATRELPDLILLDIIMPKGDGFKVCRALRSSPPTKSIPVIIMTARGKMKDLFDLGDIAGFVEKPFEADDLLNKVREILGEEA